MEPSSTATSLFSQIGVFIAVPILVIIAWNLWLTYIQTVFLRGLKWTLLEIKPPKDVFKSPLAMELVLNALYAGAQGDDWLTRYWKGELALYSSLEIASIEGSVRFFVRVPQKFKKIIETQIYSQYPQAEVFEVEDYTNNVSSFTKDSPINLWGANLILTKDDPYPIRTYVDYGLDKMEKLKDEQQIDPITPMVEFFGSIGIGEQMWFQIIIKPDTKRFAIKDAKTGKEEMKGWSDKSKDIVKELKEKLKEKDADGKTIQSMNTKAQIAIIDALERATSKFAFDTGIRIMYIANKENFNANNIGGLTGSVRQYNSPDLNGFKPDGATSIKYAWEDLFGTKIIEKKKSILSNYKSRKFFHGGTSFDFFKLKSYFTHPGKEGKKPFILNTEELATIFHLPGRVSETPTFTRIESKKAEPPANLPI
jgi:hypothetical protein